MQMQSKGFAFRLAAKKPQVSQWKARDGISVAGCTHVEAGRYWAAGPSCNDCWYEC